MDNTAWKYRQDFHQLWTGEPDQLLSTSGNRQCKAGQRRLRATGYSQFTETRFPFPIFLPSTETDDALFPREPKPSIFQLSRSTLFFSFPWYPLSPTHRVCPHTFTISFKEGFRYLVVLHRGQPWSSMAPFVGTLPNAGFSHSYSHLQSPLRPDAKQVPTNGHFAETVPLQMSTGRGQGTDAQTFRQRVFRSCRWGSVFASESQSNTLDFGEGLLKWQIVHKASSQCTQLNCFQGTVSQLGT